jgi:thiamine biosynthesis lipoprotein
MGTLFSITICEKEFQSEKLNELADPAFDEVKRIENEMSELDLQSKVSEINRNAGISPVHVSDDFIKVMKIALEVSQITEGALDVSFKPLGSLWDIKNAKKPPEPDEIRKVLPLINYRKILLDEKNRTVFLSDQGMAIGLGAVAKGYAASKAADILRASGLKNFIINAGGDLYFSGKKNSEFWSAGLQDPDKSSGVILVLQILTDCAVVTSGDYERFFIYNGRRYHHIMNPKTGYPSEGLRSVTVFAKDPAVADAFATGFFVMGKEKSLEILRSRKDLAAIFIDPDRKIYKAGNISVFANLTSD